MGEGKRLQNCLDAKKNAVAVGHYFFFGGRVVVSLLRDDAMAAIGFIQPGSGAIAVVDDILLPRQYHRQRNPKLSRTLCCAGLDKISG